MKVLVVGPSPTKSKGGIATVISEINSDDELVNNYCVDMFESYIDGNIIARMLFSLYAIIKFLLFAKGYDIYYIHMSSKGSTYRKRLYVKAIKKWGKKVIIHIHSGKYIEFYNEIPDKKKTKVINILKSADMVIALSKDWKNKFDKAFGLTNCVVLENGVNAERLASAITDPKKHMNSFVALGRLGKRKGTYDLVNAVEIAVKSAPNIKVYLAGDGDIEQIRLLVEEKNLSSNIEILGWCDYDKKLELLKKSSTVILPSYYEGLPMSILEGMACGKTIISTKVGAIPEVVKDENGILIDAGNIYDLSCALIKCCNDLEFCLQTSKANIEKIQKEYSIKTMHKKLSTYFEMCFAENNR